MKMDNYLREGSMKLRLLNYNSDLKRVQDKVKDIQKDILTLAVKKDAPNQEGAAEWNKLVNDLDIVDIKLAYVRSVLMRLKDEVDVHVD